MTEPINRKITLSLPFRISMLAGVLIIWLILSFIAVGVYSILLAAATLLASDIIISGMLTKLKRGRRAAANTLLTLVSLFLFISISVNSLAQRMLFFPHENEEVYSELKKRSEFEELTVSARDGNISGWLMPSPNDTAPLVLYFCGNAEDASARMLSVLCSSLYRETFAGCSFAVFDYPGYGRSDGKPTEASLKRFGLAVYDALAAREDINGDKIVLFGFSMGTGIANYVASEREVAGLVLMAPYADGYDLFNNVYDVFHGPTQVFVSFRMEAARFAEGISVRPLILASKNDEMIPYESSVRLSEVYPAGCDFKEFENLRHNDFWGSTEALGYIRGYLQLLITE